MQPARFHALRDKVMATVDKTLAEPVALTFFKNGKVDPSRPKIEIEAVLRVGGGKDSSVSGGSDRSWRSRIAAQKAELHIDCSKYPDLVVVPRDVVRAVSRHGEPRFEVLTIDERSMTRLVLHLGEK